MLLKGVKSGSGEVATGEITCRRLSKLLVASGEIKNVVDNLERQAKLAAKLIEVVEL